MKLSELVRSEGYGFVVTPEPWTHPYAGDPKDPHEFEVLLCVGSARRYPTGRYLAAKRDSLDLMYAATHEIAEDRLGHDHTEKLFAHQAQLACLWARKINERTESCHCA